MTQRITQLPAEEMERLFMLAQRIMSDYRDPRRGPFQIAYVFSETVSNQDSGFMRAVELAKSREIQSVGLAEGALGHGYEGFDHSVQRLRQLGWNDEVPIVKIDVGGNVNTRSEADMLVDYVRGLAGGRRPSDVCIIAPPFHLVRAFITTITPVVRNSIPLRAYAVPGVPLPWTAIAAHSQGTTADTRCNLLKSELTLLETYRAAQYGSMLNAEEIENYLTWRDC